MITAIRRPLGSLVLFATLIAQLIVAPGVSHAETFMNVDVEPYAILANDPTANPMRAFRWDGGTFANGTAVTLHEMDPDTGEAGAELPGTVSGFQIDASDRTRATFTIRATLGADRSYIVQFRTSSEVGYAYVYAASEAGAWMEPYYLAGGYAPTDVTLMGWATRWAAGATTVRVHDYDNYRDRIGAERAGVVSDLAINNGQNLTFTLGSLPVGDYTVQTTTGSVTTTTPFSVYAPHAYVPDLHEGYATQSVEVIGWLTSWDERTTISLFRATPEGAVIEPVSGIVTLQGVTSTEQATVRFASGLAEGSYVLRFTTGSDVVDGRFAVTPDIVVWPSYVENTQGLPVTLSVSNYTPVDLTAPGTTVVVRDASGSQVADLTSTIDPGSRDATYLEVQLRSMLPNGVYTLRVRAEGQNLDAPFEVGDPLPFAFADPTVLTPGYTVPQTIWVWGENTTFQAGSTSVSIIDASTGDAIAGAAGNVVVSSATELTFDLLAVLPIGDYRARLVTGTQTVDAYLRVTRGVEVSPWFLPMGYSPPVATTMTGAGTNWDATTAVTLLRDGYDPVPDAIGSLNVTGPTSLSFQLLTALDPGYHTYQVETGDEIDWVGFLVDVPNPQVTLTPWRLEVGHAPTTITVSGDQTSFATGSTVVTLFDDWTGEDLTSHVSDVSISSPTALTFRVSDLPRGEHRVVFTTGDEVTGALLLVDESYAYTEPSFVKTGYAAQTIQLIGLGTSWTDATTVTLYTESGTTPLAGITARRVISPELIEVDLAAGLPANSYRFVTRTGSSTQEAWFYVMDPMLWLANDELPVGYATQTIHVNGFATTFQQDVTTVSVRDMAGATVRSFAGSAVTVLDEGQLTFSLTAGLPEGTYTVRVTTGTEVAETRLRVLAPSVTITPSALETGYATPRRIDVWARGTSFPSSPTVTLLSGTTPVSPSAIANVRKTEDRHLQFDLTRSLPAGTYTVRIETGPLVLTTSLVIASPRATTTSTTGSTTVNADGTITVTMPRGSVSALAVTFEPTCADGSTPSSVVLRHAGTSYTMSPIADGSSTWSATIPQAAVTAGSLTAIVTCGSTVTDVDLGGIVLYDPSGIVSNANTGAPVVGASVSLFKVPDWSAKTAPRDFRPDTCQSNESKAAGDPWDQPAPTWLGVAVAANSPEIDPHVNPQITNAIGYYGWDVAAGCWYVVVSRTGYRTLVSPVVGVPSEVTDLHLQLTPLPDTVAPTWTTGASLTFSEQSSQSGRVTWPAATDDIGVDAYRVLRDGTVVATLPATARSTTVTGLTPSTAYTISVQALDTAGNASTAIAGKLTTLRDTTVRGVERVAGEDRYGTAAALARRFSPGVPVVYIATGQNYPDALAGGPAAAAAGGPILLVRTDEIPAVTGNELTRLKPGRIVVLGGELAITPAVATALGTYTTGEVSRLAGADRYETAVAISKATRASSPVVFIATGENYPDALTAGTLAARDGAPILLTRKTSLPDATRAEIQRLGATSIVVAGGEAAVSKEVEAELAKLAPVTRVFGETRYHTATAVAARYAANAPVVYVSTGQNFPDALASISVAGPLGAPLVLVKPTELPQVTAAELQRLRPTRIVVLGGPAAVSDAVRDQLATFIAR